MSVDKHENGGRMPEKINNSKSWPLVTAVITTYNRPLLVQHAIQSVLAQTYKPLEIIIVNDGSDSKLENWLHTQGLNHIKYIKHKKNQGLPTARNTGLKHSKGKYITYLDDDDLWKPEKIKKQVMLAERLTSNFAIIYCGLELEDESGQIVALNMPRLKGVIRNEIVEKGLNTIPSSFLFRKDVLLKIGGFDTDLYTGIDHDLWMKIAKHGYSTDYVNDPLVIHKQHGGLQMTSNVAKRITGIELYLKKWKPDILSWYGSENGNKYCIDYYIKVIGALGLDLVLNGNSKKGKKILWDIFLKEPKGFLSKPHLFTALFGGKKIYKIVAGLKKRHA